MPFPIPSDPTPERSPQEWRDPTLQGPRTILSYLMAGMVPASPLAPAGQHSEGTVPSVMANGTQNSL